MAITDTKLFQMMRTNLSYLGERQTIISQNIANANTPGYEAKDLKPLNFDDVLGSMSNQVSMTATNAQHMGGNKQTSVFGKVSASKAFEITPTGNKVVLENQMMEASKNSMEYQKTTNIYKKMLDMFKVALGQA